MYDMRSTLMIIQHVSWRAFGDYMQEVILWDTKVSRHRLIFRLDRAIVQACGKINSIIPVVRRTHKLAFSLQPSVVSGWDTLHKLAIAYMDYATLAKMTILHDPLHPIKVAITNTDQHCYIRSLERRYCFHIGQAYPVHHTACDICKEFKQSFKLMPFYLL